MPRNNNNKKRHNKRGGRSRRQNRRQGPTPSRLQISNIENKPKITRSIRYQSVLTSTNAMSFYSADMLTMLVSTTTGSTAINGIFDSLRINSVTISAYQTTGALESVAFKWESVNAPETLYTLVCQSAVMAHGTFSPPEESSARWWMNSAVTSYELFSIVPSATTLDIILDINFIGIMNDGPGAGGTLNAVATFTGIGARNMPATTGAGLRQFVAVGLNTVA